MYRHVKELQFEARPAHPDAAFAGKIQELVGGQFGEMSVMMQYMFQGFNCRLPGKYKDMILDIGTEEIGHVEMLCTMIARLLEGAPNEVVADAAAGNPALAAVLGGMNVQHAIIAGGGALPANSQGIPWNAGYIVASGNLLTDFRSNVHAEAQSRLQTSRIYNMTDDPGVKDMLKFNLARDTFHQQQWLRGIEELVADGLSDVIEDSNAEHEDADQARTYWNLHEDSAGLQGSWAQGRTPVTDQEVQVHSMTPASTDDGTPPPPDPSLFSTYDGSLGKPESGEPKPTQSLASKVKKALD